MALSAMPGSFDCLLVCISLCSQVVDLCREIGIPRDMTVPRNRQLLLEGVEATAASRRVEIRKSFRRRADSSD